MHDQSCPFCQVLVALLSISVISMIVIIVTRRKQSQRTYCVSPRKVKFSSKPSDGKLITEKIVVSSNQKLLLRTKLDKHGKYILFKTAGEWSGFKDEISIYFPQWSVLGTESLFLEVIPADIIRRYNEKYGEEEKKKVVTPVLHVNRENGAPFLRAVTVTLPLLAEANRWIRHDIRVSNGLTFWRKDSKIEISTTNFSPTGVSYCEVRKILQGMSLNDHFNLKYKDFGVYLMVEQYKLSTRWDTELKFVLRKFRDWQEHDRYRRDATKLFCLLLNPENTKESDRYKQILVSVSGCMHYKDAKNSIIEFGRPITFPFPDPLHEFDDCNERYVQLTKNTHTLNPKRDANLGIKYTGGNMKTLISEENWQVPILTQTEIEDIQNSSELVDHDMLVDFLAVLRDKWTKYLTKHLKLDLFGFCEFILQDIKASIPVRIHLPITNTILADVTTACRMRGYTEFNLEGDSVPSLIESIFHNFRGKLELARAKREIISILKSGGAILEQENLSENLLLSSREVLAAALMYIPVNELKESMRGIKDDQRIPESDFTNEMLAFID